MNLLLRCLMIMLIFVASMTWASSEPVEMKSISINFHDKARLQRGAKLFMNYCSGCHSLKYLRYERMAKDLGITKFNGAVDSELLYSNLIFTKAKMHEPMDIAMPKASALQWFGIVPPDLSLTARQRGTDWIYTYLNSFYADENRPFGANNLLVPDIAMPNILAPLQGLVVKVDRKEDSEGTLLLLEKGQMTQPEFDNALNDIVSFLAYVSEPAKLERQKLGIWVLLFLFIFLLVAYRLKKAYWKELQM